MIVYGFPGQGSQSRGMGSGIFNKFKELTTAADDILGYSIEKLCLNDEQMNLNKTQYAQPALYIVNSLCYLNKIEEEGEKPDYVLGHSLGEYNALFAADVFDFEAGLKLVKKRGELMSKAPAGGMVAIAGIEAKQIEDVLKINGLDSIDIANYNSRYQSVISGPREDIEVAKEIFKRVKGVQLCILLKTSGAFHSRYMQEAKMEFEKYLTNFEFVTPKIPVVSNVHATFYSMDDIKKNLADQITCSVRWADSIRYLMNRGDVEFEEIGYGKVLSGLFRRIKNEESA